MSTNSFHYAGISTFMRSPHVDITQLDKFDAVVVGVPFEAGVSYREGTKLAPRAIREAAFTALPKNRKYIDLDRGFQRYIPKDIEIADIGDIRVWPMEPVRTLREVHDVVRSVRSTSFPIILGGDHSITGSSFPACMEACEYNRSELALIVFDADLDTEDSFATLTDLWHGSVIRYLVDQGHVLGKNVYIIGTRGIIDEDLFSFAKQRGINIVTQRQVSERGIEQVLTDIEEHVDESVKGVYLSVDIDVLDPSIAPGTGWLSWGGMKAEELLLAMRLMDRFNVVCMDVVEVSPPLDPSGLTTRLAFEVIWSFLRFGIRKTTSKRG